MLCCTTYCFTCECHYGIRHYCHPCVAESCPHPAQVEDKAIQPSALAGSKQPPKSDAALQKAAVDVGSSSKSVKPQDGEDPWKIPLGEELLALLEKACKLLPRPDMVLCVGNEQSMLGACERSQVGLTEENVVAEFKGDKKVKGDKQGSEKWVVVGFVPTDEDPACQPYEGPSGKKKPHQPDGSLHLVRQSKRKRTE